MRRRFLFLVAGLIMATLSSTGFAQAPVLDKDYTVLKMPLETDSGSKIEVAEFFWYRCPHCFALEPGLNQWSKTLPKDAVLRRIPAVLRNDWAPQAKVWYAMEALGVANKYHDDFFNAIHLEGLDANSEAAVFAWAARMGMNQQDFGNAYNSFGVQSKVMRAAQLSRDAQINGVPSFVVDGQYVTSESMTGSEDALFKTLDALIVMARKAHHHSHP